MTRTGIDSLKNILERKMQLVKDQRGQKKYFLAVEDYHEYICRSEFLTPIFQGLIAEDKIAPIYLKQIFVDFLLSFYKKHEVPSVNHYPNFYTPEIEEKYKLMRHFVELTGNDYEEYQSHPNRVYIDPNIPLIKTDRAEEFYYTQKLHNDILEKLEELKDESPSQTLKFDSKNSILYFAGKEITISKRAQSDAHDLLQTMFKDKSKLWNNDEILDEWRIDIDKKTPKTKVYQAAKAVNRIIAQKTQIEDFLVTTTKNVSINKKYLDK